MKNTMTKEHETSTSKSTLMSERILQTIEKKGLTPKPKWHFFLKEWFVWGMVCVALFVGSVATALTIYIGNASRFIEHQIVFSDILFLFQLIPFLWVFLFGIAVFYTVYALRETRRGYKWNPSWLVGLAFGVSVLLGSSAYASGLGEAIDQYLLTEMPMYRPLTNFEPKMWMNSELGIVAGIVTEVRDEVFTIEKLDGELLEVYVTSGCDRDDLDDIHEGMRIRLVGTTTQEGEGKIFETFEIKPFYGRGGMMHQGQGQGQGVPPPIEMRFEMKEN